LIEEENEMRKSRFSEEQTVIKTILLLRVLFTVSKRNIPPGFKAREPSLTTRPRSWTHSRTSQQATMSNEASAKGSGSP